VTTVAVIPARGGSRRIPRKNIADFGGHPMLHYAIQVARVSALFDLVVVSSEDNEILAIAEDHGAIAIRRAPALARDDVGTMEVVAAALHYAPDADRVCCIYPCVPLLLPRDLIVASHLINADAGMAYAFSVGKEPALHDAGQFYWGTAGAFRSGLCHLTYGRMYVMPPERDCDINTPEDWKRAEALFWRMHERGER
jgi:CMP-N-acetylneuraminic acid synthetase